MNTDIRDIKMTEAALRESREDFDRAQEEGQIGWWRLDTWRNILTWSDENYRNLVQTLAGQFRATVDLNNVGGTECLVTFGVPES